MLLQYRSKVQQRNNVLKELAGSTRGSNKETLLTTYQAIGREWLRIATSSNKIADAAELHQAARDLPFFQHNELISHRSPTIWTSSGLKIPDNPIRQWNWDSLLCSAQVAAMKPILSQHRLACFEAGTCKESGAWLNCLPSAANGCRIYNDSFCPAVSTRLGLRVCTPHRCRCSSRVDEDESHPPSCRFIIGRLPRNTALSDVICRSLQSARIPAFLKSAGLDRGDGSRHDGISLFSYARRKSLVLDVTCIDTFSPSNMIRCAIKARAAANDAESRKRSKYASHTDRFNFHSMAVETSGVFGESTHVFLLILGSRIASAKVDVRERTWLIQRISLAVVRSIAISIEMSCRRFFLPPE